MRFAPFLSVLFLAAPVAAQDDVRRPVPEAAITAYSDGNLDGSLADLEAANEACQNDAPVGDRCFDLLIALCRVTSDLGERQRALAYAEEAARVARTGRDREKAFRILGGLRQEAWDFEGAERAYRISLEEVEAIEGRWSRETASAYDELATAIEAQGRNAEAEALFRIALEILDTVLEPDDPRLGVALNNLAVTLHSQKKYREAGPLLRRAITLSERGLDAGDPELLAQYQNYLVNLTNQYQFDYASQLAAKIIAAYESAPGTTLVELAVAQVNLGSLLHRQGRFEEADAAFMRAYELRLQAEGTESPALITVLNNLAYNAQKAGRTTSARESYRAARGLAVRYMERTHRHRIAINIGLADLAAEEPGGAAQSRAYLSEAIEGVLERMSSFTRFDEAAQAELRQYRPYILRRVKWAWDETRAQAAGEPPSR